MKSIAELSNELNVSKTSIYNILKKNETALKEHTHKKQGKTFLDNYAEMFLIDYYTVEINKNLTIPDIINTEENEKESTADSTVFNDFEEDSSEVETDLNSLNIIAILQKQLKIKDEQLKRKDEQIKDLTESIKTISIAFSDRDKVKQQELFLEAMEKKEAIEKTAPSEEIEPPKKTNFINRFLKKLKNPEFD